MTTALVIGDPHFKICNKKETDLLFEYTIREAKSRNPDFIVVLGDILDRHESIHVDPLCRAINFLVSLTAIAPTYVLIGNHDLKNHHQFLSDIHPFTAFKYWDQNKITIVDTVTVVTIKGQKFVFAPYVPPGMFINALDKKDKIVTYSYDKGKLHQDIINVVFNAITDTNVKMENLEKTIASNIVEVINNNKFNASQRNGNATIEWRDAICIFAHQEFAGAKMGYISSSKGDKWSLEYPYVISGHIHDYQELQENILYVGTPFQQGYADTYDKSISYFTFNENEKIPIHERIRLNITKKKIIRITCEKIDNFVLPENCDLKIIIRGTSGEIKAIRKHPNIEKWQLAGVKINYKEIPLEKVNFEDDEPHTPIVSKAPLKFSQVLYNSISDKPRLGQIYNNLFGIPVDTLTSNMQSLKLNIVS